MFNRLYQGLYILANTTDFSEFANSSSGEYQYTVSDGFAIIFFELYETQNSLVVYITDFRWPYKKDQNSWWYVVENNQRSMNIRLAEVCIKKW